MNHHLRFSRQSACLGTAGIAFLLSSCSSTEPEPPLAAMQKGMTYEVRIFELPAGHQFGDQHLEIMQPQEAAELLKKLNRPPGFSSTISGKAGQTRTLSNKKDFVYPTEWTPAQFSRPTSGAFPVTPATPSSFETTKVGTTVSFTGQQKAGGLLELDLDLHRKTLLGFINYGKPITTDASDWLGRKVPVIITENRKEKPVFGTDHISTSIVLTEGGYLVLRNPDATPVNPVDHPYQEKRPPGFIALIRVASR